MNDPRTDPTQPPTRPTEVEGGAAARRPPPDPADPASAPTHVPARRGIATTAPGTTPPRWGDYEFVRELGRGGMGVVYEARQVGLDRRVAVKVMLGASDDLRRRFEREARALARIASPHVVQVLHAGERDGDLYFAMEYVEGEDLARRLKRGWRPTHRVALDLVRQAATGLAAAAEHGLIHRDIKPANLMLAHDGTLKLMDFGLVRGPGEDGSLTSTGMIMGTVNYFSPEQGTGVACDARSDIYSLGVAFFELLTGRVPFEGDTVASLIYQHVHVAPPPPRAFDPTIPESYQAVVLRCLAKPPDQRYQDARSLIADLDRVAAGRPAEASRRRWLPAAIVAGAVAATLATAAVFVGARTPAHPIDRAERIATAPTEAPMPAVPRPASAVAPAAGDDGARLAPRFAAALADGDADAVAAALDAMIAADAFRADLPEVAGALRRGTVPADFALRRAASAGAAKPELLRLALEQLALEPRIDLARLVIVDGDDAQRLEVLRLLGRRKQPVPELRVDLVRLLEQRPVHPAGDLPQREESLIDAAVVLIAADLPPELAGRVARLSSGATYAYQALLAHAPAAGVPAVLEALLASGRFRRDHYGMDEALARGAIPADFAATHFPAADEESSRQLLFLAEAQVELHGNESAHRFLWGVVFSQRSELLRTDAFAAQLRAARARGMERTESGELVLRAASLRRFFDAPERFWPRFADALADPVHRQGMLRDATYHLLRSTDDGLGELLAADPVAAARVLANAGTVLEECEPLAWAAADFLSHAAHDARWRPTVDAAVARWQAAGVRTQEVDWLARNSEAPAPAK